MTDRCGICLKSTRNKKQHLRLVTSDAEDKLQFGYYSIHQTDLNRSLFNTKVHQKCYHKYIDRWYNESVRKIKVTNVSSNVEHELMSINDENNVSDERCLSNICNIDNDDDDYYEYDDDDNNNNETFEYLCSKTTMLNQSISQKNKPALIDISNIDYSQRDTNSCNRTHQIFPIEDLSVHDINDENNDVCSYSVLENNTDSQHNNILTEKKRVINGLFST
jgi:hypothetical protein